MWGSSVAGYLAQEFPAAELCQTVYDWISEKPGFWDASPKELAQIGRQMHLSPEFFYSDQKIATLSGGEKVKLQVAALLLLQPDVLLLDEPSNRFGFGHADLAGRMDEICAAGHDLYFTR